MTAARSASLVALLAALCIVALCACEQVDDARVDYAGQVAPDGYAIVPQAELDALRANQAGGDTVLLTGRATLAAHTGGASQAEAARIAGEQARASCGQQAARYASAPRLEGDAMVSHLRVQP